MHSHTSDPALALAAAAATNDATDAVSRSALQACLCPPCFQWTFWQEAEREHRCSPGLAHTSLAHVVVSPARMSRTYSIDTSAGSWYQVNDRDWPSGSLGSGRRYWLVLVMLSATRSEALSPTFHTKVGSPLRSARAACVSVYTRAAWFLHG